MGIILCNQSIISKKPFTNIVNRMQEVYFSKGVAKFCSIVHFFLYKSFILKGILQTMTSQESPISKNPKHKFYAPTTEVQLRRWLSWLERSLRKRKVRCSNSCRERLNSLKHVVTAPLPNTRLYVWVSRVVGDDHYKRMPRVTVGVARY